MIYKNSQYCRLLLILIKHPYNEKKGTIITRCEARIAGFSQFKQAFFQQVILAGRSKLTFDNYIRAIAEISLYYNQAPLLLTDEQINCYLTKYKTGKLDRKEPSEAYFKHIVYGLRYMFKAYGIHNRKVAMPNMKYKKPIRDIMNRQEVMQLLKAAVLDKHRMAFAIAYGSGLRISEVLALRIPDIDIVRKTVHVRNGKGGKDRIVPIGDDFIRGYRAYIVQHKIKNYLFPGKVDATPLSVAAMRRALATARRKAGITKQISMHNMRHSYAVHFLEDTGDLLKLKQYLGHTDIKTTMTYLTYAQNIPQAGAYSPLTKVFELARSRSNIDTNYDQEYSH